MSDGAAAQWHPETAAVAAGRGEREPGGPLNAPLVPASVFHAGGEVPYARSGHPTWASFEDAVGALEGGRAVAFASGMGAVAAALERVPVGGVVVAPSEAYTGLRMLLDDLAARGRLGWRPVPIGDTAAVLDACDGADLLWVESPTNPLLVRADVPALVAGAARRGIGVVVDNTFATPLRQRPLADGADVVVHSATKMMGGHSDLLLGVAVTRDEGWLEHLRSRRKLAGAVPGVLEAWLALRGLRTLPARLDRSEASVRVLAERLAGHPGVAEVHYPGFANVVSFVVAGGAEAAEAACEAARLIVHATSLGGVESSMERRARHAGEGAVSPALVRLSVGCEHVEDLWADLAGALDAAGGSA